MLKELTDLPPPVIGFQVEGKLTAEDYRDRLLPALQKADTGGEIRVVIVIPEFEGFTGGALWQDLKMGVENWGAWKRIALVTDVDWMKHATDWFGWMTPGQVQHFPLDALAEATAWAAAN